MEGFNSRTLLVTVTVVIVAYVFMARMGRQEAGASTGPASAIIQEANIPAVKPTPVDDRDEAMKEMEEEMDKDRQQQRRIRSLKMQREETDLELEEQKALSQLNKLKMDNLVSAEEPASADSSNLNIKVVYLGGSGTQREAILSINGMDYTVKEKDRVLKNLQIQSITDNEVAVHSLDKANSITTYQFKPQ